MSIKFLTSYGPYPSNSVATFDADTEAALVAAGVATTDTTGGVPYSVAPTVFAVVCGSDGVLRAGPSPGSLAGGIALTDPQTGLPAVAAMGVDVNGTAHASIIPRTNTVASLKGLVGAVDGELASATDTARIVQIHTTGINSLYSPDTEELLITGSGDVSVVLPTQAKNLYLAKTSTVTAISATLAPGVLVGQDFNVHTQSLGVLTLTEVDAAPSYPARVHKFTWNGSAWRRVGVTSYPVNYSVGFDSYIQGANGFALGRSAVSFASGISNGYRSLSIGGGHAIGFGSLAVNNLVGNASGVFGAGALQIFSSVDAPSPVIIGDGSAVVGNGQTGFDAANGIRVFAGIYAIAQTSSSTYSVTVSESANFQVGCTVCLVAGNSVGPSAAGTVTAVAGNVLTVEMTTSVGVLTNSAVTPAEMLQMSTIYNTSEGARSVVIGAGSTRNSGALVEASNFDLYGSVQSETYWLATSSSGSSTPAPATKDNWGEFTGTGVGLQNSFVIEAGCVYQIEFVVIGRDTVTGDVVKFRREMVVGNVSGTASIKQLPIIIGTDLATGVLGALTYTGTVNVSIDASTNSLRFSVTGADGRDINWGIRLHALRVI